MAKLKKQTTAKAKQKPNKTKANKLRAKPKAILKEKFNYLEAELFPENKVVDGDKNLMLPGDKDNNKHALLYKGQVYTGIVVFPDSKNEIHFVNGLFHGLSRAFYNDGQVKEVMEYSNNVRHGNCVGFYKDGSNQYTAYFLNDELTDLTIYTKDGEEASMSESKPILKEIQSRYTFLYDPMLETA